MNETAFAEAVEIFADRYRITGRLGRGGAAVVDRAVDLRLKREVALKRLVDVPAQETTRVLREARIAAALQHPNIVAVYDVGVHEGVPFLVMEVIEGESLRYAIGSPAPIETKLGWLADVARALDAAHRIGLVHRDVKPQNVLVAKDGAKLLDFGLAKELDEAAFKLTALLPAMRTQPGFSVGTPQYMAPEVLRGHLPADAKTDQFAWGLVAYQLVTGEPAPREGILKRWSPPPITVPGVPAAAIAVIQRALAEDRAERFASMHDLAKALGGAVAHPSGTRPRQEAPVAPRAPKEALLASFGDAVRDDLKTALPLGFHKAIAVVTVDVVGSKMRFFVQLTAMDASAELWAPAASEGLLDAAKLLIAADSAGAPLRWHRLVLRLEASRTEPTLLEVT